MHSRRRSSLTDLFVALSARGIRYSFVHDDSAVPATGAYFLWAEGIGMGMTDTLDEALEMAKEWMGRLPADG